MPILDVGQTDLGGKEVVASHHIPPAGEFDPVGLTIVAQAATIRCQIGRSDAVGFYRRCSVRSLPITAYGLRIAPGISFSNLARDLPKDDWLTSLFRSCARNQESPMFDTLADIAEPRVEKTPNALSAVVSAQEA